jgi:hypothetical protein
MMGASSRQAARSEAVDRARAAAPYAETGLKLLQHRALQPAVSALTSKDVAVHTLLQDWKSLLQTRTLSLPGLHAEGVGWSD